MTRVKGRFGVFNLSSGAQIDIPFVDSAVLKTKDMASDWNNINTGQVDTVQKYPVGTVLKRGGRTFAYAEFGGTVAVGEVVSSEVPATAHDVLAPVAAAIGAEGFSITSPASGTDDFIVNEYAGGMVYSGSGNGTPGYGYRIATNAALDISATATMAVVLDPGERLTVALAATDDLAFVKNPWKEVIISATTVVAPSVGVTLSAQADGQWGWLGVKGAFPVKTVGTLIVGQGVKISTTAGAVMIPEHQEATDADRSRENTGVLGVCADIGASTEHSLVNFNGFNLV